MSAGTLATWIAATFALAAAVLGWRGHAESSRRSLAMCATFAGVATAWLVQALWQGNLGLAYVARHVLLSDDPGSRVATLFAEPAGAGLACATVVALAGWWVDRHPDSGGLAGPIGVIAVVLLAAPLVGAPLALLPFQPADGGTTVPYFAHSAAHLASLALLAQVTCASLALAIALAQPAEGPVSDSVPVLLIGTLLAAGVQALAWLTASIATGASDELQVALAREGVWFVVVLVSALALRVTVHGGAPALAIVEASLAALLIAVGSVLATGSEGVASPAARALFSIAVVGLAGAVWRGFPGDPRTWHGRVARLGVAVVLACTLVLLWFPGVPIAPSVRFVRSLGMVTVFSWSLLPWRPAVVAVFGMALLGGLAFSAGRGTPFIPFLTGAGAAVTGVFLAIRRGQVVRAWLAGALAAAAAAGGLGSLRRVDAISVAAGTRIESGGTAITHQGVSTYTEERATVLALALEQTPGAHLGRAEQREYVDARGAVIPPVWLVPASFMSPLWAHAVWLDRVDAGDRAEVRVGSIPGQWGWVVALACLVPAALALRRRRHPA
jgi:hypothetical protein